MSNGYTIHENLPGDVPPLTRVQKIKQYVAANLEEDLGIRKVGEHFGLSPTTIDRLFRKHVHQTYWHYVDETRIQKAFELITQQDMLIKEAMHATGYKTKPNFIKAFKRKYGYPPSHFKTE